MKHWVIKREDQSLDIIVTSNDIPPDNALCPAYPDWKPELLTYDPKSKTIVMDPDKARIVKLKTEKFKINYRWVRLVLIFVLGFIVGYFLKV